MADYSITMNNPVFPEGQEFIVVGFPASLVNGETSTIAEEDAVQYEEFTGNDFLVVADGITGGDFSGGDAPAAPDAPPPDSGGDAPANGGDAPAPANGGDTSGDAPADGGDTPPPDTSGDTPPPDEPTSRTTRRSTKKGGEE